MLATCFMLTVLFYIYDEKLNVTESWISSNLGSAAKPHWSKILSGPPLLVQSPIITTNLDRSFWMPFLEDSQQSLSLLPSLPGSGDNLVILLNDLCKESFRPLEHSPTQEIPPTNPYMFACSTLAPALRVHFNPDTSTLMPFNDVGTYVLLMSFPSRLNGLFVKQLAECDPVALLLVGYWLALLAKLRNCEWWCLQRVRKEGGTVLRYLENVHAPSPKLMESVSILRRVLFVQKFSTESQL
jgi:hypothetical protein